MFCTEMSCKMRYKLNVIMLIMYLYVLFTLLIISHNKRSQLTMKPRISIETDVVSMETDTAKTSVGASAGDKHCSRKDHVVYIKTHKTGSTTVSHIFWR